MRDFGRLLKRLRYIFVVAFFAMFLCLMRNRNAIEPGNVLPLVETRRENNMYVRESLDDPWKKNVIRKNITARKVLPLSSSEKTEKLFKTSNITFGTTRAEAPVSVTEIKKGVSSTIKSSSTSTSISSTNTVPTTTLDPSYKEIKHFVPINYNKIDWHNYEQMRYEKTRVGLGEQGKPATPEISNQQGTCALGYNEALSDKIALNRSLPDLRHPGCAKKLYLESLPTVSVVIPFYNERLSTLLRTVHSVLNRSPPQILQEIILVDDNAEPAEISQNLAVHVSQLPKVTLLRPAQRTGLMGARNAGAQHATADVLVVLDSHVEANVNWLPPLIEPIALEYRTVVVPNIDFIKPTTFGYHAQDQGRGLFSWELDYWRQPLLPKDVKNLPEPYETPTMTGGLFAISRAFFWELGGYDPGMREWAGEQYELSFKVWQCGGRMLEAPCSHVGHLFRVRGYSSLNVSRNFRRVIDVWMDEYAQHVYKRLPYLAHIDPGDLTDRKMLRLRLQCKPFHWFLTHVAFDLLQLFPLVDPEPFAQGRIRSKAAPDLCLDAHNGDTRNSLTLRRCENGSFDEVYQEFVFTWRKELRVKSKRLCCDVTGLDNLILLPCHLMGGNQLWRYHPEINKITFGVYDSICLDYHVGNRSLFFTYDCADESETQEWIVDNVNYERMSQWEQSSIAPVTAPAATDY